MFQKMGEAIGQYFHHWANFIATGIISLAVCSCSAGSYSDMPTLDIASNVDCEDRGNLNDIFDLYALVYPEFTDSTLLAYPDVKGIYGNTVYVQQDNRLMTFDISTGKSLSSFDHGGQGPEDYIMLSSAFPSKENGDWIGYDLHGKKLVHYTVDGKFLGSCHADLNSFAPSGKNYAGQKYMEDGYDQIIYIYNDKFQLYDSIQTHKQRSAILNNLLLEDFNNLAAFRATDTLYIVSLDNRITPAVAFNLKQYAPPCYKMEESEKYFAERSKYLYYVFHGAEDIGYVFYRFDDKNTLQYYSLLDNSLLFSCSVPSEKLPEFQGFAFVIDGKEYYVTPLGENPVASGMFCFQIDSSQFGNEDDNPAILILKPKKL